MSDGPDDEHRQPRIGDDGWPPGRGPQFATHQDGSLSRWTWQKVVIVCAVVVVVVVVAWLLFYFFAIVPNIDGHGL